MSIFKKKSKTLMTLTYNPDKPEDTSAWQMQIEKASGNELKSAANFLGQTFKHLAENLEKNSKLVPDSELDNEDARLAFLYQFIIGLELGRDMEDIPTLILALKTRTGMPTEESAKIAKEELYRVYKEHAKDKEESNA